MKNNIINDELIVRYLTGEAIPEEAIAMHNWLKDPENKSYFEKIQSTWNIAHPSKTPHNINRQVAWNMINAQLIDTSLVTRTNKLFSLKHYSFALKIAASFFIVAVLSFLIYSKINELNSPEVIVSSADTVKTMRLPDNSNITLNQNSKLTYAYNFGKHSREIRFISGEAFFKVAKNKAMPFVINTNAGSIKVVGTSFNVTLTQDKLNVAVSEGRVLLYTASDSVYLEPGFRGTVKDGKVSKEKNSIADINTWGYATRKFVFKNSSLREVVECLRKAYPYTFYMQNKNIANCKLTATFDNVSAEYILNLMSETLNLRVIKNDNSFILDGKGCP